jgi:hypothetical protein
MNVASTRHISQDIVLEFGNWLQSIWYILVLLDVPDDLGGLRSLRKVDELRFLDDGRDTVLNERQVREVNTEEGYARRVGFVKSFSVLQEVLGASH